MRSQTHQHTISPGKQAAPKGRDPGGVLRARGDRKSQSGLIGPLKRLELRSAFSQIYCTSQALALSA